MIRKVEISDAAALAEIYNYYVLNSIATFVEVPFTVAEMEAKINEISSRFPWFVYEVEGKIIGYAYANEWNARAAYRNSVESTIYLSHKTVNKGVGTKLYSHLIAELKSKKYHVIIGGISLPNAASQGLHEKFGYKKVAHYKEVGFKFNEWIDVGYWQLVLD